MLTIGLLKMLIAAEEASGHHAPGDSRITLERKFDGPICSCFRESDIAKRERVEDPKLLFKEFQRGVRRRPPFAHHPAFDP